MKDLQRADPYLNVVKELQKILKEELSIKVEQTSERYKPWTLQTGLPEMAQQSSNKKRKTLQPAELRVTTIKKDGMEIPTHLVQMYETQGHSQEEALTNAYARMEERHKVLEEGHMAIRLKERTVEEIEETVEGKVVEIPIAPELRSTHRLMQPEELAPDMCKAVIVNRLVERCEQKGMDSPKVKAAKVKAAEHRLILLIIDTVQVRGCTSAIRVPIRKSGILENPLRPGEPAQTGKGNEEVVISVLYGEADKILEIESILERKGNQKINNMYQEDGSTEKWVCPACKQKGERINRYLGMCKQKGCLAIAPDSTFKDISKKNKRKKKH